MKKVRIKWISIGASVLLLLILAAAGFAAPRKSKAAYQSTDDLNGKTLAGIASARMPETSGEVLFETILGVPLAGFHAKQTVPELFFELSSGRCDAIVCPDVCAEYLLKTEEGKGLIRLTAPKDTSNGTEDGGRLAFAMVLRTEESRLQQDINLALSQMKADGTMGRLVETYVAGESIDKLYEKSGSGKKIVIGVTGTLPPLDLFDVDEKPCGFSVALLAELSARTDYHFVLEKLTPEDSFTSLMNGKVDALFAYGTSKNTTPKTKDYIMTDGYYTMQEYAYLAPSGN